MPLFLSTPATAQSTSSRPALVTADDTVAASERQAVLALSRLGLETQRMQFPVTFCNLKGLCLPVGSWTVNLSQADADRVLASNMSFLVPSRYDQMIFEGDTASFITATRTFNKLPLNERIPALPESSDSYREFDRRLLNHLNTHIAPQMQQVMGVAAEARYQEMNAQERGTFLREQARATGMPAEVLEALVSSGYAFGFYLPRLQGSITIRQVERTTFGGVKYIAYETSINAPARTRMLIYRFDGQTFRKALEVDAQASVFSLDGIAQRASAGASVETLFLPGNSDAQQIFDDAFKSSFKDSTLALSARLREHRMFAVSTPVLSARPAAIQLAIGNQEDIRVDHPVTFRRVINNREREIGWGQVYQPGNTCLAQPAEQRTPSYARLVNGRVDEADLAVEHPWTGVFATLGISNHATALDINEQFTGAGDTTFFDLGFSGNLGYLRNNPSLSGLWLNFGLGLGASDDGSDVFSHLESSGAIRFNLGLEKQTHLSSGLYASLGADLGVEAYQYDDVLAFDELQVVTWGITPKAGLGYYFSPNTRILASAGYHYPLSTRAEYKAGGRVDADMQPGLTLGISLAIHLDFAGPYAGLMTRPSDQCNQLRDRNNRSF
ncbi:hypothetical protein [Marinospirillum alkaliphilum]|uniref:hypothetical protein n=1 Tax=Marinospirillum alkaliphilum TaxID=148454 RepID=UPI00116075BA|nr:hypothetical protein [Marinospirillum alkaliphilum]